MIRRSPQRIRMALRSLFRRHTTEQELDEELKFHLAEMEASGGSVQQAGWEQVKDACRDVRTLRPLEDFFKDLRIGTRRLYKNPGFALTACATIALGVGATMAIFTLVNGLLLRPLPGVRSPQDLVLFADGSFEGRMVAALPDPGTLPAYSYPLYQRLRDELRLFDGIAAQQSNTSGALVQNPGADAGAADLASARCVSANYFDVLGVRPALGRMFSAAEDADPGAGAVMVLSYGYWQRRFGGSPSALGSVLVVNGFPYTVIGVTPEHFVGTKIGSATDFWVPIVMQPQLMRRASLLEARDTSWWLLVAGRVKPGVSISAADADVNTVIQRFLADVPVRGAAATARANVRATVIPGARGVSPPREQLGPSLRLLMIGVGVLLAIACLNVSHLLLARGTTRQREISLELALGATRGRILRRHVTEGFLLAIIGGAAGLVLGHWSAIGLVQLASTSQQPLAFDTSPDARLFLFAGALIVAMSIVFGAVPMWRAWVLRANSSLAATQTRAPRRGLLSPLMVVVQVALSLLLLVSAALLTQTLRNLQDVDKGFREEQILVASVNSRLSDRTAPELVPVYGRILERVASLPGVQSASMALDVPLSGNTMTTDISVPNRRSTPGENLEVQVVVVTPGFFETLQMSVLEGRHFSADDRPGAPHVAVINEAFARRFFDRGRVLGNQFQAGGQTQPLTVIGVAKNARFNDLRSEPRPTMYLPVAQSPEFLRSLQVRSAGEPNALAPAIREIVRTSGVNLVVQGVRSLEQQVDRSLSRERLVVTLAGAFGAFALVLVCVGLYGVLAQTVVQRTAEIGVRVALGASRRRVQWLVLRESVLLTLLGLALGLPAALNAAKAMKGLLFGVSAVDGWMLATAAIAVATVAMAASYVPAWRAAKIDPIEALRCE
jgi:predicted permease